MIYCKLPEDKDDQAPIRFIVIYNDKIHDGLQYVLIFCTLPGAMKMHAWHLWVFYNDQELSPFTFCDNICLVHIMFWHSNKCKVSTVKRFCPKESWIAIFQIHFQKEKYMQPYCLPLVKLLFYYTQW